MPEQTAAFVDAANPPENILIVKPSSLGDVVHTLPAVSLLKERWPTSRLRWLVNTEWAPLLAGNPDVDEIIEFPRSDFRGLRGLARITPWARRLREHVQADLVLDFQGLLRSALLSHLCRKPGGRIIGLSDAREGARNFYDTTVDVSAWQHAVARYLALICALGHAPIERALFRLPPGTPPAGHEKLEPRYVLLHPFSRGQGKSLTSEQVAEFCQAVAPLQVVVAGRTTACIEAAPNVLDYLNRTDLRELIYLLRRADWIVSVDSGPMHIAAALTSHLVSIHTWSDPAKVGPYDREAWIWQNGALFQMKDTAKRRAAASVREVAAFVRERVCA